MVPSCLEPWPLVSPHASPSSTWPAIIPRLKRVGPPGGAVMWTCTHSFREMWGWKQLSMLLWSLSSWERMGSLERRKQSKREEGTGETPGRTGGDKKHGKCHESQRRSCGSARWHKALKTAGTKQDLAIRIWEHLATRKVGQKGSSGFWDKQKMRCCAQASR